MSAIAAPVACAVLAWWFATGLILLLVRRPRASHRWSLLAAAILAGGALWGLAAVSDDASAAGAYVGFACAVALWGFLELGFLTGIISGARRHGCAEGCGGWRHFGHAIEAILHHELAIIAVGASTIVVAWGAPNPIGAWTFVVLWVMRQSAKLNLFLGVRNLGEQFLPPHLDYLKSFFRRRPINLLFPLSVTAPTIVAALLARAALAPEASAFEVTGHLLVATLLALAALEHWLLVLPLSMDALWRWAMRAERRAADADDQPPARRVQTKVETC
jgi:putative photosynthetic complex assembly protein 2